MSTATQQVDAPAWLSDFYAKVDGLDVDAVASSFSANATWRFGSGETAVGRDSIRGGMKNFPHIRGIRHEFLKVWDTGSTLMVEANVTYTTLDGREVTVPALTVIEHRDGGVIDAMRIFIDPTPVAAS